MEVKIWGCWLKRLKAAGNMFAANFHQIWGQPQQQQQQQQHNNTATTTKSSGDNNDNDNNNNKNEQPTINNQLKDWITPQINFVQ